MTANTIIIVISILCGVFAALACFFCLVLCKSSSKNEEKPKLGIAKFEKVSYGQFYKDWIDSFYPDYDNESNDRQNEISKKIEEAYTYVNKPTRSTKGSAGYDFVTPLSFTLLPGATIKIPTGIRCAMTDDYVLCMYPRSGLGFKYQMNLANQTGIIDSDYFYANNEGHIMAKIVNRGDKTFKLNAGDKFCQGIFFQYGVTIDDEAEGERHGGFGSTGN